MKRALIVALLLAGAIAAVSLRSFHSPADQPELERSVPQAAASSSSSPLESREPAIEVANAAGAPKRESIATESDAPEAPALAVATTTVRVDVRYTGSGRPVRAAHVYIGHLNLPRNPVAKGSTDEHGVAVLVAPEGSKLFGVSVNATDEGDVFVPYERTLEQVAVPGSNEILVRVDRGTDLRGVVRAAGTGNALPGAIVRYRGFGYGTNVKSDGEGAFLCEALLVNYGNPWPLEIQCEGYLPATVKPHPKDVEPGAEPILVLLERGITISGRIVDSDRKPVAGAYLEVLTPRPYQTVSDENGYFEFGGFKPTDEASLHAQTQSSSRPPFLERSMDLGVIRASRFDVEFEVQRAIEVRVFAELPDGSSLSEGQFEVDWGDGTLLGDTSSQRPSRYVGAHARVFGSGQELEIRGYARVPGTTDRASLLTGTARIRTGERSPFDAHLRLSEPIRLAVPPLPPGATEVELSGASGILGALDVQVFDEYSSQPIEGPNALYYFRDYFLGGDEPEFAPLSPGAGGWLRIWHRPGSHTAMVGRKHGSEIRVSFSIPPSGYAKTEWRLRSNP